MSALREILRGKTGDWGIDALVVAAMFCVALPGITVLNMVNSPAASDDILTFESSQIIMADTTLDKPELQMPLDVPAVVSEDVSEDSVPEVADNETQMAAEKPVKTYASIPSAPAFISLMGDTLNPSVWYQSKHANTTGFYGADWKAENISAGSRGTGLAVKHTPDDDRPYTAAEMQTLKKFGYGKYEAMMRPARGSGIVSAFFTYTGPHYGDPHDEIDFEFLGADLTQVHLNYWRNGKHGDAKVIDLPFDAGEEAHLYTFEWAPDRIIWKIDGKKIHETIVDDPQIPRTPSKIFFSTWTGIKAMEGWHGPRTFETGAESEISCVSFVSFEDPGRSCSDLFLKEESAADRFVSWLEGNLRTTPRLQASLPPSH